jgi:hypothetical protein
LKILSHKDWQTGAKSSDGKVQSLPPILTISISAEIRGFTTLIFSIFSATTGLCRRLILLLFANPCVIVFNGKENLDEFPVSKT